MKMFKNALMALIVSGLTFGISEAAANNSSTPDPASVKLLKSEKKNSFRFFFNPVQQEKTTLLIKDMKGKVVWKSRLGEAQHFAKLVNLGDLDEGQYNVIVTGEDGEFIQPVNLENKQVNIDHAAQTYYKFPGFTVSDELVEIELLTSGAMDVKIAVFNKNNETLYKTEVPVSGKLIQRLDISDLEYGSYSVKVETPHRSFYKEIEIR